MAANLRVNGWFYLADARFPPPYTLLALLGLFWRRAEAGRSRMALYFLLFFGIALLFYAGSYDYGADVRYSLATYPPLTILPAWERPDSCAGCVAVGLRGRRLTRWLRARRSVPLVPAVVVRRPTAPGRRAPTCSSPGRSCRTCRGTSYVLTQNPGMFQLWGINAGQMSLAVTNPARLGRSGRALHRRRLPALEFLVQRPGSGSAGVLHQDLEAQAGGTGPRGAGQGQHYTLYRLKDPLALMLRVRQVVSRTLALKCDMAIGLDLSA